MKLFDTSSLDWIHLTGDNRFDYPIDYWASVLTTRPDGHIDILFRWEPNSYCHFHRHLVDTRIVTPSWVAISSLRSMYCRPLPWMAANNAARRAWPRATRATG